MTRKKEWLWAILRTRQLYFIKNRVEILETPLCKVAKNNCDKCIMRAFKEGSKNKYCLNRNTIPYSNTSDLLPTKEEELNILRFFKLLHERLQNFNGNVFVQLKNKWFFDVVREADQDASK